jgi:class 3 adenylate cyclase/CHASE2 domain-containing sensor protein
MRLWQEAWNETPLDVRITLAGLGESTRQRGWTDEDTLRLLWRLHQAGAGQVVVFGPELFLKRPPPERLPPTVRVVEPGPLLLDEVGGGVADVDGRVRSLPVDHPGFELVRELCRSLGQTDWEPRGPRFYLAFETRSDAATSSEAYLELLPLHSLDATLATPEGASPFRGGLVLLTRAATSADARAVPAAPADLTPAAFYANAINTMLSGWSLLYLDGLAGSLLTLLGMAAIAALLSGRPPHLIFLGGVASIATLAFLSLLLFDHGVALPTGQLLIGAFLTVLVLIVLELHRARRALESFGGAEDAHLAGQETQATILFTELPAHLLDLERRQSDDLLARRRDYNRILQQIARKYHGQVLDYQGDAQMIGFGLRHEHDDDHPLEATAAALELVAAIPTLAETWGASAGNLRVHAGVCTGVVALGHVGAVHKQDVAAIGDTTNTAARLMGAAMKLDLPVVVAETTFTAANGRIQGRPLPPVELKGKSAPVAVYAAEAVDESWRQGNRSLRKARIPSGGTLVYRGGSRIDLYTTLALAIMAFSAMLIVNRFHAALPLEGKLYDAVARAWRMAPADPRIVIVGIDGESCQPDRLGPFPWSRGVYAKALQNLSASGYKSVFFDILFKQPRADDPGGDEALGRALLEEPRAKVGVAFHESQGRLQDPLFFLADTEREQLRKRHQLGLLHKRQDVDGVLRWSILAARETASDSQSGKLYPTGAVAAWLSPGERFEATSQGLKLASTTVPSTTNGSFPHELLIRFGPPSTLEGSPPAPGSYRYVSFWRLLEPSDPIFSQLNGAYLFVGDTFRAGERERTDLVSTPVGRIKGVEAHARTLDTLLNRSFTRRLDPRAAQAWLLLLAGLTTYILARYRTWHQYLPRLLALMLLHGSVYLIALLGFSVWMDGLFPLAMMVGLSGAVMLGRFLLTLRALSRFVPPEVAQEILFHHQARDRRVVATVLLTDIRGYTTLSEGRSAAGMLDVLNEYHRRTVDCYQRHGGQALTYQGDAQIVVFGVFGRRPHPVRDAVAAALELQAICAQLRREWGIDRQDDFDVGAGLCTGEVEVGFLGGKDNLQYSVVGETVRKSHKVQSLSTELQAPVILDEETFLAGRGQIECDDLGLVQLKGVDGQSRLYRARGTKESPESR